MQIIPVQAVPNQTLNILLGNQPTTIEIASTLYGVFISIYLNGSLIIGGVLCLNAVRIIRDSYLSYQGDFLWVDLEPDAFYGPQAPSYPGLGSRFILEWLTPSELAGDC